MSGFTWYPGARRRFAAAVADALEDTGADILQDLDQSGTLPHAERTRPYLHRRAGLLQESGEVDASHKAQGRVRVVYDTPFARRAYFRADYDFRTTVNPNARGRWFDPYLRGGHKAGFAHDRYMRHLRERLLGL